MRRCGISANHRMHVWMERWRWRADGPAFCQVKTNAIMQSQHGAASCDKNNIGDSECIKMRLIFFFLLSLLFLIAVLFPTEASLVDFINLPFQSIFITPPSRQLASKHLSSIHITQTTHPVLPFRASWWRSQSGDSPFFKTSRRETARWP